MSHKEEFWTESSHLIKSGATIKTDRLGMQLVPEFVKRCRLTGDFNLSEIIGDGPVKAHFMVMAETFAFERAIPILKKLLGDVSIGVSHCGIEKLHAFRIVFPTVVTSLPALKITTNLLRRELGPFGFCVRDCGEAFPLQSLATHNLIAGYRLKFLFSYLVLAIDPRHVDFTPADKRQVPKNKEEELIEALIELIDFRLEGLHILILLFSTMKAANLDELFLLKKTSIGYIPRLFPSETLTSSQVYTIAANQNSTDAAVVLHHYNLKFENGKLEPAPQSVPPPFSRPPLLEDQ